MLLLRKADNLAVMTDVSCMSVDANECFELLEQLLG